MTDTAMTYDSSEEKWYGLLPDGTLIAVDADVYAEEEQRGVSACELRSPMTWENCVDGERVVRVTQKEKSKRDALGHYVTSPLVEWDE